MDKMQYDRKQREIKDNMLKAILEYRKRFSPVDQYETLDRIDWIYEELRSIPD
jgi:adenine-specific DNA methylase